MRLLLACLVLFLAPAGALLVTTQKVDSAEGDFAQDAASQIARLDRVTALYPPNVRKMRAAPAILQLKQIFGGSAIAATVCATPDSPYQRLFERLNARCDSWRLYRRARSAALLGALAAVACFTLMLLARINVRRFIAGQTDTGVWTRVSIQKGLPLLLIPQIVVALSGYGVLLQSITGKTFYAVGLLTIPFCSLLFLERRLVLAFVEPQVLGGSRSRVRVSRRRTAQS